MPLRRWIGSVHEFLPLDPGPPRRAPEPLGDPRDPQAHRAPGHRLAGRRAALARRLPGRGAARRHRPRAARGPARGAAVRRQRRLRPAARMGRRPAAGAGCGLHRGPGADHHRLAAGAGPGRQGADRPGQRRRRRIAHLPGCAAGLCALRTRVRAGGRRRRRPDARGAGRGPRRAFPLPAAQLPEPGWPLHGRRAPRGAGSSVPRPWACRSSKTTPTATSGTTHRRRRR